MKFDNPLVQKLNQIADWIIRIVVINFLVILFSIPLVTMFNSFSSGYRLFHDYINKKNTKLFSGFFTYFKEYFKTRLMLGLLMTLFLVLGYLNVTYYVETLNQGAGLFYHLGYYVTISFLVGAYIVYLYLFPVSMVYPTMKFRLMIKLAFFVSGKFVIRTMLLIISTLVPFLLLFSSITSLIFVFAGVSLWLLIAVIITNEVTDYLERLGKKND